MPRQLEDTDLFPFGKYGPPPKGSGKTMEQVPASYYHWLWTNGKEHETETCAVAAYIKRNLPALKQEHRDGIW
jgi:hypothetical protein